MATNVIANSRHDQLRQQIRTLDERLSKLASRHATVRAQLQDTIQREDRSARLFAEGSKEEKLTLEKQLASLIDKRVVLEREAKALAITIGELQSERSELYPEFEKLELAAMAAEARRKKAELAQEHTKLLEQRAAWLHEGEKIDSEILRVGNSIRFIREQEMADERQRAEHVWKTEAQRRSPLYRGN